MSVQLFGDDVLFGQRFLSCQGFYRGKLDGVYGTITGDEVAIALDPATSSILEEGTGTDETPGRYRLEAKLQWKGIKAGGDNANGGRLRVSWGGDNAKSLLAPAVLALLGTRVNALNGVPGSGRSVTSNNSIMRGFTCTMRSSASSSTTPSTRCRFFFCTSKIRTAPYGCAF